MVTSTRLGPVTRKPRPQHVIEEAIKRNNAGESVDTITKHYKVSRAQFYNWKRKYQEDILERARRAAMSPETIQIEDKQELIAENKALKMENQKLRNKLLEMLLKSGQIDY